LQTVAARQRMHEALYNYIEHVHDQASKIERLSFVEEKEAFDRLFSQPFSEDSGCKVVWECQQAVARVASLS